MTTPDSPAAMDHDTPWKEATTTFFEEALGLFLPEAHAEADWSRDQEHLETEMRRLLPESATGQRRVDRLVKLWLKGGGDESVLVHIEAQMQRRRHFGRRVYEYNSTAEVHFRQPIVSLAILGDASPDWRPTGYRFERWGTRKLFRFRIVKLLDWRGRDDELLGHANPFAVFVLAHLKAQETRKDAEARAGWKLRLAQNYLGRTMLEADRQQWLRLLDWMLPLPARRNRAVWEAVYASVEGRTMPFVSYFEQRQQEAVDRAVAQALEAAGKATEEAVGKAVEETQRSATLQATLRAQRNSTIDVFKLRFPAEADTLAARVEKIDDPDALQQLFRTALTADLAEVERHLPS